MVQFYSLMPAALGLNNNGKNSEIAGIKELGECASGYILQTAALN